MDDKLFGINTDSWFSNNESGLSQSCNSSNQVNSSVGNSNVSHTAGSDSTANTGNTINNMTNAINNDNNSNSSNINNNCGSNSNSSSNTHSHNCGCSNSQGCCGVEAPGAEDMPGCRCVGYGYVPWQMIGEVYKPEKGLNEGTVFPELALTIEEYGKICRGGM